MINFLLKNPNFYRFYQKIVRSKYDEFDFFEFIFKTHKLKNIRMLDICCGDSYILQYVSKYIDGYMGVDNNDKYLNKCRQEWKSFEFINLDFNDQSNLEHFIKFKPNFIFINGAIHHLDDKTVKSITSLILNNFSSSYFLSVDPVKNENKLLNSLMIKLDRGKFIRNTSGYSELMKSFDSFIVDDFYKMNFKSIFHYKNLNLQELYQNWKAEIN
tara:strand:- start:2809 stop:3450 length:642 start_codon:yes stop_codon:yes gene_type:complete